MKKIITSALLFLLITNTFSQMKKIDSMLVNIDKTNFTDILYERTTPWAKLSVFNDSINISTKGHFEQALHELYKSSNEQKFTNYRTLRNQYTPKSNKNTVDIGIINTTFNELNFVKDDETKSGIRITNNKFEKINNTKPAFKTKHVIIIAPLKEKLIGDAITYKFNNQFIFQETNKSIQTVVANFDTQQDFTIIDNGIITTNNITINYTQEGLKMLTFTVTFTDGSTTVTNAILTTTRPLPPASSTSMIQCDTIIATETFKGTFGEIEYCVFYHTKNESGNDVTIPVLKKPIIIIDGFDPGDERGIGNNLTNPNLDEDTILKLMWYEIEDGDSNPDNNIKINLVTKLRERGYDVVIVNQIDHTKTINGIETDIDGGADYIERNAMAHIALYQQLNNELIENNSSEELVVMGPSMGGQISRYALAYMEKKYELETDPIIKETWNHNCRLWVSIDSPHLGANVPVGQQSLINVFADILDNVNAEDTYYNVLKSVAGNQQLIEQHQPNNSSSHLNNGSPVRQEYLTNLTSNGVQNSNGYPMNLRKIAMVNGSLLSVNVGVAGEEDFRVHSFIDFLWGGSITVSEMHTNYMPNTGNSQEVSKIWRQFKPTHSTTYINNNPNGSMDIVPGGLLATENTLNKQVTGTSPDIVNFSHNESVILANLTNYLSATGNATATLAGIILLSTSGDRNSTRVNKQVHSFVPTVSALGFKNPNFNWSNDINRNLVCTDEIPFDNYYGPIDNTSHISFTEESIDWLFQELDADPVDGPFPMPSVYLNSNDLIGDNTICNGETKTYYFEDCKVPSNVTWSTHNSLEILSSTNTNVTVKNNNFVTALWIKATFSDGSSITKNIVCKPSFIVNINSNIGLAEIQGINLDISQQNITNISWVQTGGTGVLTTSYDNIYAYSNGGFITGEVTVTNSCGSFTSSFAIPANPNDNPCNDMYLQKIANNKYKVSVRNPCNNVQLNTNINNSKLFNTYGIEEHNIQYQNNEIDINNSPSGSIKIIKATVDNKVIIKRVIVD